MKYYNDNKLEDKNILNLIKSELPKEEILKILITEYKMTNSELAVLYDVHVGSVGRWFNKYNLKQINSEIKYNNLEGRKFFMLKVLKRSDVKSDNRTLNWDCICECGNNITVNSRNLITGKYNSCGCYKREPKSIKRDYKRLYDIWMNMKSRCCNPNHPSYRRYGEIGISICDEWIYDFENFKIWSIDNGYDDNLSIDRIDNYEGYNPTNCRWATTYQQANNKRNTIFIDFNGEFKTLAELCRIFDLDDSAYDRISYHRRKCNDIKILLYKELNKII